MPIQYTHQSRMNESSWLIASICILVISSPRHTQGFLNYEFVQNWLYPPGCIACYRFVGETLFSDLDPISSDCAQTEINKFSSVRRRTSYKRHVCEYQYEDEYKTRYNDLTTSGTAVIKAFEDCFSKKQSLTDQDKEMLKTAIQKYETGIDQRCQKKEFLSADVNDLKGKFLSGQQSQPGQDTGSPKTPPNASPSAKDATNSGPNDPTKKDPSSGQSGSTPTSTPFNTDGNSKDSSKSGSNPTSTGGSGGPPSPASPSSPFSSASGNTSSKDGSGNSQGSSLSSTSGPFGSDSKPADNPTNKSPSSNSPTDTQSQKNPPGPDQWGKPSGSYGSSMPQKDPGTYGSNAPGFGQSNSFGYGSQGSMQNGQLQNNAYGQSPQYDPSNQQNKANPQTYWP